MTLSNSQVSEKLKVRITIAGFYKLGEGEAKKLRNLNVAWLLQGKEVITPKDKIRITLRMRLKQNVK